MHNRKRWQKAVVAMLAVCLLSVFAFGCGTVPDSGTSDGTPDDTPALAQKGEIMQYTQYNLGAWLKPIWNTREIYNETVLFVGEEDAAPLLYTPAQVLSVRSYGLDVEYREGKDYEIKDGKICRLPGSDIPYFTVDEYYSVTPHETVGVPLFGTYAAQFSEQRYIKYGEGDTFTSRQIAVTYTHDMPWTGEVPADKSGKLHAFVDKLKNKQETTVVFNGDSITVGCNASGTQYGGNTLPDTPSFATMFTQYLQNKYDVKINCVNTAVGGTSITWGADNVQQNVVAHHPDLAVLAFGMNDPKLPVSKFRSYISEMIDEIHAVNPDCAVIVIGTSVPNNETDWYNGNQRLYAKELLKLESANSKYTNVAVANMTVMHEELLKIKRFRDMTGNNINHPNDFLVRAYAQVLLQTLLGNEFTV